MNIVVDNLLIRYAQSGKGKVVVLLHGWGDNLSGLASMQQQLSKNYQVVSLDLPGFGSSQAPTAVWNLDNYAAFLQDFLAKTGISAYAVIGHSNGGALAIRAISLGLVKPQKLILLAASGIRAKHTLRRLLLKVIAKTGNVATIWLPKSVRAKLRAKLYGVAGSDMLVVEQLKDTFKATVRQDVQADAAKLTVPTLLIYAQNDKAVPVTDGLIYKRLIKNSRLQIINDASHFVHLDKPHEVTALIEEFLK